MIAEKFHRRIGLHSIPWSRRREFFFERFVPALVIFDDFCRMWNALYLKKIDAKKALIFSNLKTSVFLLPGAVVIRVAK